MKLIEQGGNRFYIADPLPDPTCLLDGLMRYAQEGEESWERHERELNERLGYEHLVRGVLKAPFATPGTRLVELLLLKWRKINLENSIEELRHPKGFSLLIAHGSGRDEWNFWDGENKIPVQEWVDQVDGKHRAVFIHCCNPNNLEIKSGASVIVHPRGVVSPARVNLGLVNLRVYRPQVGYLN